MKYKDLLKALDGLRGHFNSGFSLSEKSAIVEAYGLALGKKIKNLDCADCYRDAYIELYTFAKKQDPDMEIVRDYVLKEGEILHVFGTSEYYSNPITNEIAEAFLKNHPNAIEMFKKYPNDWRSRVFDSNSKDDNSIVKRENVENSQSSAFVETSIVTKPKRTRRNTRKVK